MLNALLNLFKGRIAICRIPYPTFSIAAGTMWVLSIEDEVRLADLIRRGLEAEGFSVAVSHDGVEGEEMASLNRYDALIVDWRLPKQDGRTLIKNLRAAGNQVEMLPQRADLLLQSPQPDGRHQAANATSIERQDAHAKDVR